MAQIVVRLKDRELQRVVVTCVATRIGRDATNDVVINNDGISRHHATVRYEPAEGMFMIYDASSSNGVYIRGRASPAARLIDGDEVQIGKFTLVFLAGGGVPPDALAPEINVDPAAPAPLVRNPLPTMALRAAVPRSGIQAARTGRLGPAIVAPKPSAFPIGPPAVKKQSDAPLPLARELELEAMDDDAPPQPLTVTPLRPPPEEEDDRDDPIEQARLLRRVMWVLVAMVGLLGVVVAMLFWRLHAK